MCLVSVFGSVLKDVLEYVNECMRGGILSVTCISSA